MATSSDFRSVNVPGVTKEVREGVTAALDALSIWRDEIETANQRCLGTVLDQTSAVARSMGWPDQAVKTSRDYLEQISKAQTKMIDGLMESWKEQLKSPMPMEIPHRLTSGLSGGAKPEFNPLTLTPWAFWMQAAEMWQRTWMPDAAHKDRSH
jgi:hypothetical protein